MGILTNINKEKFCLAYLKLDCDTSKKHEIMEEAGYKFNRGYFSKLYNDPEIQGRILELQQEAANQAVMGLRERLEMLSKIARDEKQKPSVRMSAADKIHKQSGDDVVSVSQGSAQNTTNVVRMVDLNLPKRVSKEPKDNSAQEATKEIYGEGVESDKDKQLADELNKLDSMDL